MHIVFCADRKVLAGLHVAAYSLLSSIRAEGATTHFHVFSDRLTPDDMTLLKRTLKRAGRSFTCELCGMDSAAFSEFPSLNGGWATYYRLMVPHALSVDRFLYVDADTLCDVDVSELNSHDMGEAPAGWVPEAPLPGAADRTVAAQLGNSATDFYFNAGVMLINVVEWKRQKITERCMDYLRTNQVAFWDQSALNFVLHDAAMRLGRKFNCIANIRENWPSLRHFPPHLGRLVHFLDYPKPWDLLAEFVHPHYALWRAILDKTEMREFRSWHPASIRQIPTTRKALVGYKKAFKDRLLFEGYRRGWLRHVKGVPAFV